MEKKKTVSKKPASEATIFKNMMITIFAVASVFFLKNVIGKSVAGAATIGACLLVFIIAVVFMKKTKVNQEKQQLVLCIGLIFMVFCISLNSGNYYSDDFPLYLAVIGISGLYLVPKYTIIQGILIDIILVVSYLLHPEKADPIAQYIMCIVVFSVGAYTFYMVIKRGRAYIEIGEARAEEAERLLEELKMAGGELQNSCEASVRRMGRLERANEELLASAEILKEGSEGITRGTVEVAEAFGDVQGKMQETEAHIGYLNTEVKKVETSLVDNKKSMHQMTGEMEALKTTINATGQVFSMLQNEILEISKVTEQLTQIASSTTMLALNASIEAARAGQAGAGFAVVAEKVQQLAEDSNQCSSQVVGVVKGMQARIEETTQQLADSTLAINTSIESMKDFQENFDNLTQQFDSLYHNIEEQNNNIHEMDAVFEDLKVRISEMAESSEANKDMVEAISCSVDIYKENIEKVVKDNKVINELAVTMLEMSEAAEE